MSFSLPKIEENLDGWGPTDASLDQFKSVPSYYIPYNKGDKLGKVADWQAQHTYPGKSRMYHRENQQQQQANANFTYNYQEDDSTFTTVDSSKSTSSRKTYTRQPFRGRQGQGTRQSYSGASKTSKNPKSRRGGFSNRGKGWGHETPASRKRDYSVEIKPEWILKDTLEFSAFNKLDDLAQEPQAVEITSCGEVKYYDPSYDRLSSNAHRPLQKTSSKLLHTTTSDDLVIRRLGLKDGGTVFGTDLIFSHLMTCTRSVIPWDLIVEKVGKKLFFDVREGTNFERLTVSETLADQNESSKTSQSNILCEEATRVNLGFMQQVLLKNESGVKFAEPLDNSLTSPGEEVGQIGYRYRKWDLGDDIVVVSRCEVNCVSKDTGKFHIVKALNEYDPKVTEYRKLIDTQRSSILLSENKQNSFKLAKWSVQSYLSGASSIKLGYVTRTSPKDYHNHFILTVQDYDYKEFASQIGLKIKHAWAILKQIITKCMKLENGKYLLLRDNEKTVLRLYSVPQDTFEKQDEDERQEE